MAETLASFLDRRMKELDEAEVHVRQRMAVCMSELRTILDERKNIEQTRDLIKTVPAVGLFETFENKTQRLTIKEAVVEILRVEPNGLKATQILTKLKSEFSMDYERTSLSPQLSRLKTDHVISLRAGVWTLNENGPGANAPEPS